MTEISFLHGAHDRIQAVAAWLGQPDNGARKVLVFAPLAERRDQLDRLLWTHPPTGFIAHCLLAGYAWEWVSKDDSKRIDSHEGLRIPGRQPPSIAFRWADKDGQRDFNLGTGQYNNALTLFGSASYPAAARSPGASPRQRVTPCACRRA